MRHRYPKSDQNYLALERTTMIILDRLWAMICPIAAAITVYIAISTTPTCYGVPEVARAYNYKTPAIFAGLAVYFTIVSIQVTIRTHNHFQTGNPNPREASKFLDLPYNPAGRERQPRSSSSLQL